ncbi:MAG: hypothetical protein RBT40_10915 [Petrimonas sp.]|jgi:N-acetyl-beta-hexosaminidase|nr:hypothetical protein [Petrimonas sp.]
MIGKLYKTLKDNEFDLLGHCTCCAGDKWTGHASYCKVDRVLKEYEASLSIMDDNTHHFGGDEVINSLCAAIEALEEFQGKHYDWRWVRKETEAIKMQLESALSRFESLLEDMEEVKKEEALA